MKNLHLILIATAVGTPKFFVPKNFNIETDDVDLKTAFEMAEEASKCEEGQALLGDPAMLPTQGSDFHNSLLQLTAEVINSLVRDGAIITQVGDENWDANVMLAEQYLQKVSESAETEQPLIEVPTEGATPAEIVAEAQATPEGVAVLEDVVAAVEEQTGVIVKPEIAVKILQAHAKAKAVTTLGVLNQAQNTLLTEVFDKLKDVLEMNNASGGIIEALSNNYANELSSGSESESSAALPETVEAVA